MWQNPAYLPTDIQIVKAVDKKELAHLTDVIVFSTKGNRSKVSLLSGGDYDGDTVFLLQICANIDLDLLGRQTREHVPTRQPSPC
jgi:hypothetical protein